MSKHKINFSNQKTKPDASNKASDSETSELEITESEEEMFTQEDFEDVLKRVSRICEPDEERI